jgi:hypothetical protein
VWQMRRSAGRTRGFFRGYAHLEKHVGASGMIERLEPVEQWFWLRDGMFGDWEASRRFYRLQRVYGVPVWRSALRAGALTVVWYGVARWQYRNTS